ncbi:MAG: Peptide deformylase [Alphaproteobacteria bacterium ADurb.Bin438]|nr:MAG: Peptide deformylase [Alphaproteobacteria bacterium ADurb.Bin438]
MAVLKVLRVPNPILKQKAKKVEKIDDELKELVNDMFETMYATNGIGLAAPQIGISKRLIVIDTKWRKDSDEKEQIVMINPDIYYKSEELRVYCEGCLSVPGQYEDVTRPDNIKVRYTDLDGNEHDISADGILATVIQHETDHLNGVLFIDYLSSLKRNILIRKVKKMGDKPYNEDDDEDEEDEEI